MQTHEYSEVRIEYNNSWT